MNKYIGERLRIKRELTGYTQEEVADKLNVATSTYGKLERGETLIDVERLKEIADIFETSIADLIDLESFTANKNKSVAENKEQENTYLFILQTLIKINEKLPELLERQNKFMERIIDLLSSKKNENAALRSVFVL
ncbi:MAG: helix-turn-helix transcriptional regulator [Lacibacter sp.]